MKEPPKRPNATSPRPATDQARADLVKAFRAYLHLVMTAHQAGGTKAVEALPGPDMAVYCRALAELPGNTLATELANAVTGFLQQITPVAQGNQAVFSKVEIKNDVPLAVRERLLEQLDFALALMMRQLPGLVAQRAEVTQCRDLLNEAIYSLALGGRRAGGAVDSAASEAGSGRVC